MQTWLCFCLQFFQRYFLLCDASTGYKVKHRQEVLSLKKKRELNNLTNKQKKLNFTPKASLCTLIISRTAVHLSLSDC